MQEYNYTDNGKEIVELFPCGEGCGKTLAATLAEAKARGLSCDKAILPEVITTLRAGLIAAWEGTFTAGERAFLNPVFTEALAAFDKGDMAKSKEIVATAPSISKDLDKKKAVIVGLFP